MIFFILIIYSFDIFVLTFSRDHATPPNPPTPLKNSSVLGKLCDPIFSKGGGHVPPVPPSGSAPVIMKGKNDLFSSS